MGSRVHQSNVKSPFVTPLDELLKSYPDLEIFHNGQLVSKSNLNTDTNQANNKSSVKVKITTKNRRTIAKTVDKIDHKRNDSTPKLKSFLETRMIVSSSQACTTSARSTTSKRQVTNKSGLSRGDSNSLTTKSRDNGKSGVVDMEIDSSKEAASMIEPKVMKIRRPRVVKPEYPDTKEHVDDTIAYSVVEICQRLGVGEIPEDPLTLCRGFSVSLEKLDTNERQTAEFSQLVTI